MALLILVGRPMASFAHDLVVQQAIAPGMTNLIRWQTHRYVLRQSVTYFANDFAGRIASNIVQAAASLRESVVQIIDALWFVTIFALSALVVLAGDRLAARLSARAVDRRLCACDSGYFVPRIRRRSEELAHMRAMVTGRIVDSYTNIQTVKLFAHLEREDDHAREALADRIPRRFARQTRLITLAEPDRFEQQRRRCSSASARSPCGCGCSGAVTLGDIAIATGLALRVVTMSGWVMWTAIGIFDNVGQVQEGMRTIARPHGLVDRARRQGAGRDQGRDPVRRRAGSTTARAAA